MPKILAGKIVSLKMQKTAVVMVERKVRHPLYQKTVKKTKRYKAHYEQTNLKLGDRVKIQETRPLSKEKHFRIIEVGKQSY